MYKTQDRSAPLPPPSPQLSAASGLHPASQRLPDRVEWPTVALAVAIYGLWGFALLIGSGAFLPPSVSAWLGWTWAPLAAIATAWHASLQHEVIHGHPTPLPWLNRIIAGPPLLVWLPYSYYRRSHLAHHRDEVLTDPFNDPESFYVSRDEWRRASRLRRRLLVALNTLAGRLVLGPPVYATKTLINSFMERVKGESVLNRLTRINALISQGLIVLVGVQMAGVDPVAYVVFVMYPATSLLLLRSFAEHRVADAAEHRSIIVEAGGFFDWLFLSNNLHAVHHERPGLPWYALRNAYTMRRDAVLERNGGYIFADYKKLLVKYAFVPRDHPAHRRAGR